MYIQVLYEEKERERERRKKQNKLTYHPRLFLRLDYVIYFSHLFSLDLSWNYCYRFSKKYSARVAQFLQNICGVDRNILICNIFLFQTCQSTALIFEICP